MRNNKTALSIFALLIIAVSISICSCKSSESDRASSLAVSSGISEAEKIEMSYRQELNFALSASSAQTDEATIKEHVARLKSIDENGAERQGVSFVEYNSKLVQSGSLVVEGYLRNFSGSDIYNIECNITVQNSETQEYAASKSFKFFVSPENASLSLENKKSCPVTVTFDADSVNVDEADLSKLSFTSEFTYSQK